MGELAEVAEAMLCHMHCGKDKACHHTGCRNPWSERPERCGKLLSLVSCLHRGGNRSTCPRLDNETTTQLLEEPQSIVKDLANHIVDYLLPLPAGQDSTKEEVKACHMQCCPDHECHKACPTGGWGILKDQCTTLDSASACHQTCESLVTKCPVTKMKCHLKYPMSMPTSVKELKGLTDHVACHATCGQEMACHQGCGHFGDCHMNCPHLDEAALEEVSKEPASLVKEVIGSIVV